MTVVESNWTSDTEATRVVLVRKSLTLLNERTPMSSKGINVKVKVTTLISVLEKALTDREVRWANQQKDDVRFEKEKQNYNLAIMKLIKAKGDFKSATKEYRYKGNEELATTTNFEVTVELPKSLLPKEPEQVNGYYERAYTQETDEIKQALRLLKMSEDEFVNASTIKSVSNYL